MGSIDISDWLAPEGAAEYHKNEYAAASSSYYSESGQRVGYWHGKLVPHFGLEGSAVTEEAFTRLANGQHPQTGGQLVKPRPEMLDPAWVTDATAWAERIREHYAQAMIKGHDVEFGTDAVHSAKKDRRIRVKEAPAIEYTDRQKTLIEIHEVAARVFREELSGPNGEAARAYLEKRNISPELAAEFGIGLGVRGQKLNKALESYGEEMMKASGLFYETEGGQLRARFQGRLMIPIHDTAGNTIAFAGRSLDGREPKYQNSPETAIYKKSEVLFNAHRANKLAAEGDGRVVIKEGYLDAIAANAAGVAAVAVGGTSFTEDHAASLKATGVKPIICMDPDEGGFKGALRACGELLKAGVYPDVMVLPTDTDEYIAEHGKDEYLKLVDSPMDTVAGITMVSRLNAAATMPNEASDAEVLLETVKGVSETLEHADPKVRRYLDQSLGEYVASGIEPAPKKAMAKRAVCDMVLHAAKPNSITALVGGDERVRIAHQKAAHAAATAMEEFAQAHMGGWNGHRTTGKWIAAIFNHDTARPENGYAAPHLHTHIAFFNMTEDETGKVRALENGAIFKAQRLGKAVYQAEMAWQLREMGYRIERGKGNAPEIAGYSKEYLESESQRGAKIRAKIEEAGMRGRNAESIAAHEGREEKLDLTPAELRAMHREHAEQFGNQHEKIINDALAATPERITELEVRKIANGAVRFARLKLEERNQVFSEYDVLTEALKYARGKARIADVQRALDYQVSQGRFVEVNHVTPHEPKRRFTTPEAIATERQAIESVFAGMAKVNPMPVTEQMVTDRFQHLNNGHGLNEDQIKTVVAVCSTRNQIMGIQGKAGCGKSTLLRAVDTFARENGYRVHGMAATGKASSGLREAGLASETLQAFINRGGRLPGRQEDERPILYLVDEASLASARQVHYVAGKMRPEDRLVVVGDTRQHQSVEAGRIFEQLQDAGMPTPKLTRIVRQQDAQLREIIEKFSEGQVVDGVKKMQETGRVTEIRHRGKRMRSIAKDYAANPDGTRVISPDNQSRQELNELIREELRKLGQLETDAIEMNILVGRQNVTGPDRQLASSYHENDVIWYRIGSRETGIVNGMRGTVVAIDSEANLLTVRFGEGKAEKTVTYDPKKLYGVAVYEQQSRKFAVGDRIQFTSPWRAKGVITRDSGVITHLDEHGNFRLQLDRKSSEGNNISVSGNLHEHRNVDHAYCMTSHSLQCVTAERVLLHVEAEDSRLRPLVNETLGYVGLSRAATDCRIYCDSEAELAKALSRVQRNTMALSPGETRELRNTKEANREIALSA